MNPGTTHPPGCIPSCMFQCVRDYACVRDVFSGDTSSGLPCRTVKRANQCMGEHRKDAIVNSRIHACMFPSAPNTRFCRSSRSASLRGYDSACDFACDDVYLSPATWACRTRYWLRLYGAPRFLHTNCRPDGKYQAVSVWWSHLIEVTVELVASLGARRE